VDLSDLSVESLYIQGPNFATSVCLTYPHRIRVATCSMLKGTLCRPLACFPATRNAAKLLQRICIASRSPSCPFVTTSALRNTDGAHDNAKATSGSSDRTVNAPSEHRSPTLQSSFDLDALRSRFKELSDRSAVAVRRRADDFTAKTGSTFSQLGSHLNRVTGYEEIESLKRRVVEQGVHMS
jgi:hypothetical protein